MVIHHGFGTVGTLNRVVLSELRLSAEFVGRQLGLFDIADHERPDGRELSTGMSE